MLFDIVSLEPEEGQSYSCLNCREFDIESDVCHTEYAEIYCFHHQEDRCPGYNPPENGRLVFRVAGPVNLGALD